MLLHSPLVEISPLRNFSELPLAADGVRSFRIELVVSDVGKSLDELVHTLFGGGPSPSAPQCTVELDEDDGDLLGGLKDGFASLSGLVGSSFTNDDLFGDPLSFWTSFSPGLAAWSRTRILASILDPSVSMADEEGEGVLWRSTSRSDDDRAGGREMVGVRRSGNEVVGHRADKYSNSPCCFESSGACKSWLTSKSPAVLGDLLRALRAANRNI